MLQRAVRFPGHRRAELRFVRQRMPSERSLRQRPVRSVFAHPDLLRRSVLPAGTALLHPGCLHGLPAGDDRMRRSMLPSRAGAG